MPKLVGYVTWLLVGTGLASPALAAGAAAPNEWSITLATDAQQREILAAVLQADTHWPTRPGETTSAPGSKHEPLVLLDSSFAFGDGASNVVPDPSCRYDGVGADIPTRMDLWLVNNEGSYPGYPIELAQALVRANRLPVALVDPRLPGLHEVSAREVEGIFRAKPKDWDRFFSTFPDEAGFVQVSRAVVEEYRGYFGPVQKALIYVNEGYRPGCGEGTLYWMWRDKKYPDWQIGWEPAPSGKETPAVLFPLVPIMTGPDAGQVPGFSIRIVQVKDQRTVDLINSSVRPDDFVPTGSPLGVATSTAMKLPDGYLRYAIVLTNTGKKEWPPGTALEESVRCDGAITMLETTTHAWSMTPGAIDVWANSVKCPATSSHMSVHVAYESFDPAPKNPDAAKLDVELIQ